MKILLSLLLIVLLLGMWLNNRIEPDNPPTMAGTPWHIEVLANGYSKVFGVNLGAASFADAQQVLGAGYELAVLKPARSEAGLEMYYSRYHAGPITGKLIVTAAINSEQLLDLQQQAVKVSMLQNGTRQYLFSGELEQQISRFPVQSLTFIPIINLDADLISERFGKPRQIVTVSEQKQHYLYPDKGLDIFVNQDGKELLQYVAPGQFELLLKPLLESGMSQPMSIESISQ